MPSPARPDGETIRVGVPLVLVLPQGSEEATMALSLPRGMAVEGPTARAIAYLLAKYLESRGRDLSGR